MKQRILRGISIICLWLGSAISVLTYASPPSAQPVLSIVASSPFPKEVSLNARALATFTITNVSQTNLITVINDSVFSSGSGVSNDSTTCIGPMQPNGSCAISLMLKAIRRGLVKETLHLRADPLGLTQEHPIEVQVK